MQSPLALARALVGALAELIRTLEAARRIAARRLGDLRQARKVAR